MLNACRRQRSVHTNRAGISAYSGVLNACRRQRSVHIAKLSTSRAGSVCSTPVGVKDRFTRPAALLPGLGAAGAQRLSASKIGSRTLATTAIRQLGVLNACRRQRSVHTHPTFSPETVFTVLNACRRQRSVHTVIGWSAQRRKVCSTPVGVKDRFTRRPRKASRCHSRAQRLSASKIGSQYGACQRLQMVTACSTPVGVKDRFTLLPGRQIGRSQVLNACRRQRSVHVDSFIAQNATAKCSTPVGVKDRFTKRWCAGCSAWTGAQRLSASKIGSPLADCFPRALHGCAQRLSASKIGSQEALIEVVGALTVLNACRRQRSVHH